MQHVIARGERVWIYCPCNCLSYNGTRTHGSVIRSASWSLSHSVSHCCIIDCLAETAERYCLHGTLSWLQVLCSHNWHKLNISNFTKVVYAAASCWHSSSYCVILLARRWVWPSSGDKPVASNSQDLSTLDHESLRRWPKTDRQTDRQTGTIRMHSHIAL